MLKVLDMWKVVLIGKLHNELTSAYVRTPFDKFSQAMHTVISVAGELDNSL